MAPAPKKDSLYVCVQVIVTEISEPRGGLMKLSETFTAY